MKIWLLLIAATTYFIAGELTAYLYPHETATAKYLKQITITEPVSGLKPIDCIYVINLDERPEKWTRMQPVLNKLGLKVNRVSAINGWLIPKKSVWELQGPYRKAITKGHLGCLLSHISILKDAYDRGFQLIWVFEDDVEFLEDINQIPLLLKKLTLLDPSWDVFYTDTDSRNKNGEYVPALAVCHRPDQKIFPLEYYTERIALSKDIMMIRNRYGMYSVLLSRSGIEKVLHYFTHVYIWSPIDIDIHYIPGIREYSPTRDIVIPMKSNISDTANNMFDTK
jgi:GR25 family glycosyltransferase involved in LPS biosynthesis